MKKYFRRFYIIWVVFALAAPPAASAADPVPGLSLEQVKAVIKTASGLRALDDIRNLCRHHRWFVSDGYDAAADYVRNRAVDCGLRDVVIHRFPSDGRIRYATQKSLPRWTVRSAELSLLTPAPKRLASWEERPITLASNSRSADVTAGLVDVGEGVSPADYEGKDVSGKLVLASSPQAGGRIDLVHRLAVLERGAAGVIAYRGYRLDDFPDLITWDHINTLELDGRLSTFGFCLSKRTGWALKRLLAEGVDVKLHARVEAELGPGHFAVVEGRIPGLEADAGEIWFIAHLDHCRPSANDNASGSAALLETARTLERLIAAGVLPRPRRTLRFLWVPEIWGTFAYLTEKREEVSRAAVVINMDMVGEDQVRCGSTFRVTETPDSCPSCLNDLLGINLEFLLSHDVDLNRDLADPLAVISQGGRREPWRARLIPYSGGSDHYVFMGGGVNIPSTMFGSWPDYFYHSSGDTPDKSDPTQLKRVVALGALTGAALAGLDAQAAGHLLELVYERSRMRLEKAAAASSQELRRSPPEEIDGREALNRLEWAARRERLALGSAAALLPDDQALAALAAARARALEAHAESLAGALLERFRVLRRAAGLSVEIPAPSSDERAAAALIPRRNPALPGPIDSDYLIEKTSREELAPYLRMGGLALFEIGAFMDGELSVLDIRNAVSAECGPVPLRDVLGYIRLLERAGVASFIQ